jgi:hypothetical protein
MEEDDPDYEDEEEDENENDEEDTIITKGFMQVQFHPIKNRREIFVSEIL